MSITALARRLDKIGPPTFRYDPDDCPGHVSALWTGDADPTAADLARIEANAPRCRLCGAPHLLVVIEEVVIDRREDREQLEGDKP